MTVSMTGFAAKEFSSHQGILMLELKSVNSRYLDLQFKLDESCKAFEFGLREIIKAKLIRGKVECKLQFFPKGLEAQSVNVNQKVLKTLHELSSQIQAVMPEVKPLSVNEVLSWPEVLVQSKLDMSVIEADAAKLVSETLDALQAVRQTEGEKLNTIINEKLDGMRQIVEHIKPAMAGLVKAHQEKLTSKLKEAMQTQDEERIAQEMVLFAQRADVDEELSRLTVHIDAVRKLLTQTGPVGKRLDFMMQEMNREANTLGAKSLSIDSTKAAMDLKVLIEQMREQIQNIE